MARRTFFRECRLSQQRKNGQRLLAASRAHYYTTSDVYLAIRVFAYTLPTRNATCMLKSKLLRHTTSGYLSIRPGGNFGLSSVHTHDFVLIRFFSVHYFCSFRHGHEMLRLWFTVHNIKTPERRHIRCIICW